MKKNVYEIPEIEIKEFDVENTVTCSSYAQDAAQFTIHGDEGLNNSILEWSF